MDPNDEPQGILLIQDEPEGFVLTKWFAWMSVMVVFVLILIYFTSSFAKKTECLKNNVKVPTMLDLVKAI
jgi:hypothetical protein